MANITPRRDSDGKIISYQIRVYRGRDSAGKQLKPYQTTWVVPDGMKNARAIERAAQSFAAVFEQKCKDGMVSPEHKSFEDYAEYVMRLKTRDKKHRTVHRYNDLLTRINDAIGHIKITALTGEHLNNFYLSLAKPGTNKITGAGLAPKTIVEHHRLIHSILAQALKEGVVRVNVADRATPPSVPKKEAEFFEPEEIHSILRCLATEPTKWQCIVNLMLATGARRGEIMALQWSAVDFDNARITICANLLYTPDKGVYLDTPKTGKSRTVAVAPEAMERLKKQKLEQDYLRTELGVDWTFTDFCFTRFNGLPMHPDSITSWLKKFAERNNLPHINPHKFRHTQASLLFDAGEDIITISRRLGHETPSTTENIYGHMLANSDKAASKIIAETVYGNTDGDIDKHTNK